MAMTTPAVEPTPKVDETSAHGAFDSSGDPDDFVEWFEGLPEDTKRRYDEEARLGADKVALLIEEHRRRRTGGVAQDTEASRVYDAYRYECNG